MHKEHELTTVRADLVRTFADEKGEIRECRKMGTEELHN
jgi:hypothetical protein